ncbi:MAG TPA: hypothetical protein VF424_14065, partial [Vicinamibacterales bacterium]
MLRKARLVVIGVAGATLLALLAVHTPPGRALVLHRVVEALRTSYGIDLRAESLSYNLLTLSAELRGVQVAAVHSPAEPFAVAQTLALSFGARTLIGDVSVKRLSIASPRVDIRRRGDGTDNLPRVSSGQSNRAGFELPPIRIDDLDVSFQHPSTSAALRGAVLELTTAKPGRISATVKAQHGVTVTVGARTIDLDAVAVIADLERERLDLRQLTASRRGGALHASGSIALGGDASTVDVTVSASSELESLWVQKNDEAGPPMGRVEVTARMTGSLAEPTITFESSSGPLAWSDVPLSEVRARGGYQGGELSLNSVTLGVAGGTVEAHGAIILDDTRRASRVEARWANIDVRRIPAVASLDGTISKSGTTIVEWRADGTSAPPRIDVIATTGVVASGKTTPIVVHASGLGNRWHVKASPRDTSRVDITATADIDLDSRRWRASTIVGRVVLRTTDLPAVIRQAQTFGAPAGFDAATAAGAIEVDATIDGTLGAVRSTGRIIGRAVTVAGLPRLDLDASFGVDGARRTSTGTFRLLAPGLESATFVSQADLTLGGSLIAAGTWSGPLSDPAVDATLAGRDLRIGRGGPVAVAAIGGAFDGVLKGPFTSLGGEGTLTIGSLTIGGLGAGAVAADLALSAGTVRVEARAPRVKTMLDIAIGLEAPNPFDGRGTLADLDIDALLGIAGLGAGDQSSLRGRVSSAVAFKGDLRNRSSTTVALEVAPIDATAFDVPIVMSRGLRASLTDGRVHLEDAAMTVGGLAVRLGGTLATDRSAGTLVLDVDGDLGSLGPWVTRLGGSGDLTAVGRITGHLETGASPAGLVATGTIDTTLATLSKGDRLLAKDVRAAIVLTGERAELREVTGSIHGGRLTAAADAPLTWLNQWLPSGLQIAQPTIDPPAVLEGTASFDVPALLELFGRSPMEAIGGSIELSAKLSASRPDLADVAGDVTLERAEVSAKDLSYSQADVTRFRLAKGALTIESLDWRGPGSTLAGSGSVGLLEGIETNLRLDVDTELGIVGALLSGRATGRIAGNIELHGQSGAVRVTSEATLTDASWLIPGQRLLFAGWSGHIRLADQALSVTTLGGTVNGGTVRIDGRLPLEPGAAGGGLTIAARDILIDVPRGLHSQLGADLVWQRAE